MIYIVAAIISLAFNLVMGFALIAEYALTGRITIEAQHRVMSSGHVTTLAVIFGCGTLAAVAVLFGGVAGR